MKLVLCIFLSAMCSEAFSMDPCASHKTCNPCIRDPKACVWCAAKQNLTSRCIAENLVSSDWCYGDIINPKSRQEVGEEQEFGSNKGKIVQMKPQKIRMKLRPGQPINFNFSFHAAEDYPVDLYFLFDASDAMTQLRSQTAEQSKALYEKMQEITKNVYLGLGTFVDKNAFPFANIKDSSLSYSFKHRLKLCDDYTTFKKLVNNVQLGKSHDFPTGGLDALAQVMVCKETIGWRHESRKIVVFLTNAPYHAAGDGKWAGIFEPYDGKCYTENQTYIKELDMDYPSTSIINELASEEEIIIIFLIVKSRSRYDHLKKVVKGSMVIPYNSKEDVSEILTKIYKKISRTLQLKVNMKSQYKNNIKISFNPNCYDNDKENCEVNPTTEKDFVGTIEVLEYFGENNIQFDIGFQGIKEKLTLDMEVINECDCEKEDNSLCSDGGIRRCGICECFPDRHGDNCMCNSTTDMTNQDKKGCIASNDTSVECNGRGSCICGSCVCDNWYKGVFCECGTNNCPSNKNGMCGGHGSCECGVCVCYEGWSGETCNCAESKKLCETGVNMCFDYGRCDCGECKCTALCDWDARSKQDSSCRPSTCPECHGRQCQLLQPYALRTVSHTHCSERVNVTSVTNLTSIDDSDWKLCTNVRVDVGCYTQFAYRYDEERYAVHVIVQSQLNCATTYYIIGGSCLGTIILIGIATLTTWKVCTTYRDRKEYNEFVKQKGLEEQFPNPLFKPAFSTFNNPAFRKQSIFYN